jgi:Uncharacterized protein conserved in bacteria (DUF2255)
VSCGPATRQLPRTGPAMLCASSKIVSGPCCDAAGQTYDRSSALPGGVEQRSRERRSGSRKGDGSTQGGRWMSTFVLIHGASDVGWYWQRHGRTPRDQGPTRALRGAPMTGWTQEELDRIGEARDLQLASFRRDGTLRPYVTMWVVRADDELYVRSAYGPNNPWFRREGQRCRSDPSRWPGAGRELRRARSGRARRHRRRLPREVRPVRTPDRGNRRRA